MSPKNMVPTYLDPIILVAVKFGRDHGCQLDGHLVCRMNGNEHVPLTSKEISSITTSSMRMKGKFKEQTRMVKPKENLDLTKDLKMSRPVQALVNPKEGINPKELDEYEEWEHFEKDTIPLSDSDSNSLVMISTQNTAAERNTSHSLPPLPQEAINPVSQFAKEYSSRNLPPLPQGSSKGRQKGDITEGRKFYVPIPPHRFTFQSLPIISSAPNAEASSSFSSNGPRIFSYSHVNGKFPGLPLEARPLHQASQAMSALESHASLPLSNGTDGLNRKGEKNKLVKSKYDVTSQSSAASNRPSSSQGVNTVTRPDQNGKDKTISALRHRPTLARLVIPVPDQGGAEASSSAKPLRSPSSKTYRTALFQSPDTSVTDITDWYASSFSPDQEVAEASSSAKPLHPPNSETYSTSLLRSPGTPGTSVTEITDWYASSFSADQGGAEASISTKPLPSPTLETYSNPLLRFPDASVTNITDWYASFSADQEGAEASNSAKPLPSPSLEMHSTSLSRSLDTSATDTTDQDASSFSAEPGPGYITAKALYWTGSRMIAALERFRISSLVRNHINFLKTKHISNQLSNESLFQILENALELSKPYYPDVINKYSIRLYLEYLTYLQHQCLPRNFLQTISSAMLTLSVITWTSSQNYRGGPMLIRLLVNICTRRPVRLHNSVERLAIQRVISPHLSALVPWRVYRILFNSIFPTDSYIQTILQEKGYLGLHGKAEGRLSELSAHIATIFFKGFQDKYGSWSQSASTELEHVYGIYPFISSFPWLATATYREEEGKDDLESNSDILVDLVASCRDLKAGSWKTSTAVIAAYRSLISIGISTHHDKYLSDLQQIARRTFSELFATIDMMDPSTGQKKALKALKEDEVRKTAMEVILEVLVWTRCELKLESTEHAVDPLWDHMLILSNLGLPNISPLAEKVLEWSERNIQLSLF